MDRLVLVSFHATSKVKERMIQDTAALRRPNSARSRRLRQARFEVLGEGGLKVLDVLGRFLGREGIVLGGDGIECDGGDGTVGEWVSEEVEQSEGETNSTPVQVRALRSSLAMS